MCLCRYHCSPNRASRSPPRHPTPCKCLAWVSVCGDLARSRIQALFEDTVGDGTYFADPNFEWEEEVEETKHGGS